MGTVLLIRDYVPDVIINTGVAGGIDPLTRVMDIVVGKQMVYHDVWCGEGNEYGQVQGLPSRFVSDEELYRVALDIPHEGQVYGGLICSGDQFIARIRRLWRFKIKKRFPEGVGRGHGILFCFAQVCYLMDIPFLSYRIISDTPGVENHSGQYRNFGRGP